MRNRTGTSARWVRGAATLLLVGAALPAAAQKREIIQLQRDMELLRESHRELQRSVDEKHAVLKTLLEQSLDAVSRLHTTLGGLQKSVQDVQANTGARMDTLAIQVQALADNLEEVKVRMGRLAQEVTETKGVMQSLDAKVAGGATAPPPGGASSAPPPSPDVLYSSALRDFTGGKYDLARQQFADYLRYFPETDLAGNAQFYLGEIHYRQRQYREAIAEYDRAIDNYPRGNKRAAARLKKGFALAELGQRASAIRELREVVRRHPGTEEERNARARLRELGAASPSGN